MSRWVCNSYPRRVLTTHTRSRQLTSRCWMSLQWPKVLNAPLEQVDPELFDIIEHEKNRQFKVSSSSSSW